MTLDAAYWTARYDKQDTGWDLGKVSPPLEMYFKQLAPKNLKILIPGCGNAYEAAWLWRNGFFNTFLLDLALPPLEKFGEAHPDFPSNQLLHLNFFDCTESFDLIIEQTFFCALDPGLRASYAKKMDELLRPEGRLVGVLFDDPLYSDHPPYGGSKKEYQEYFNPYFEFDTFETCYNSIVPRAGRELFINLRKKHV